MELVYKYKRIIIRLISVLSVISFAVLTVLPTANNLIERKALAKGEEVSKVKDDDQDAEANTNPAVVFDYAGTDYLKKDDVPEIVELIDSYYEAVSTVNMDKLESLVSDINMVDRNKLIAQNSYIEAVKNIKCYSVKGLVEGSYRVYVYYDMKLKDIDTPAPALAAFYITMASDGHYIIYLNDLDADTRNFISGADNSEDVAALKNLVTKRFEMVVETDEGLKAFCDMINQK